MKVGLVLGAGGVQGGAWLVGGLQALARETGWDPATADRIVGTSAGSMVGGLLSAGIPPWFMVAHARGESFDDVLDAFGRPASEADRAAGAVFRREPGALPLPIGSASLALRSLARPTSHTPAALLSGWLPRGVISTRPLRDQIRRVVPEGWSPHPSYWTIACDYATGERVAFGRDGAPDAELADAVAASCAIPGFYTPVEIEDRLYVDGGMYSASNLDVLEDLGLDLVICLNPTSTLHPLRALNPKIWPGFFMRRESGRRLGGEAKRMRAAGTEIVLVQPTGEDLRVMGNNLMSSRRRNEVIATAERTVARQLRDPYLHELLSELPPGDPAMIHRPDERPARWPRLRELADRVRGRAAA
jgi:NTE family protein